MQGLICGFMVRDIFKECLNLTIPFPLFTVLVTSVTIAALMVTFPLKRPPIILARTNIVKFLEQAQIA